MRPNVLLPLMVAVVIALTPHAGASAMTADGADDGSPAPMAVLSSFTAETRGVTIIGGTRTITVHNFGTNEISASVDLDPAPCDCTISDIAASHGTVSGSVWRIEALVGGRMATLTIAYSSRASDPVAIRTHSRSPSNNGNSAPRNVLIGPTGRSRHIAL